MALKGTKLNSMIALGNLFKKYTGFLRGLKLAYVANNLINRRALQHNRELYRKYGLKKSIYAPVGSGDFPTHHPDIPWLDRPGALDTLQQHPAFSDLSEERQQQLRHFVEEGYMILKGFFTEEQVSHLNEDIERLLGSKTLDFNYTGRKIMESYKVSEVANREFFRNPELLRLLNFIMGKPVIPFHTINFIEGSEQRAHSDSIHMATEPQGYLIAAWTALEKVGRHNGTLSFYPRSHRLPYVTTQDYPSGNTAWTIGQYSNQRYEDHIEQLIEQHGLEKKFFEGEAGDVFLWHANLIHGGSPIGQPGATRKSMVAHYFCEEVICYHEISQRPALLGS